MINMDWEIGLGIIVDGKIFTGASGLAGQLGHTQVVENGALCHCGKEDASGHCIGSCLGQKSQGRN